MGFISEMCTLDPRGAYFDQGDLQEAMLLAICACDLEPQLKAASQTALMLRDEFLEMVTVRLRVMLAHARGMAPPPEKAKKQRVHPFVMFREDPEEQAERGSVVSCTFDGQKAVQTFENGDTLAAARYSRGPDGFVLAHFVDPVQVKELELPNACCGEDGKLIEYTPPVKLNVHSKKRPAGMKKKPGASGSMIKKRPACDVLAGPNKKAGCSTSDLRC